MYSPPSTQSIFILKHTKKHYFVLFFHIISHWKAPMCKKDKFFLNEDFHKKAIFEIKFDCNEILLTRLTVKHVHCSLISVFFFTFIFFLNIVLNINKVNSKNNYGTESKIE